MLIPRLCYRAMASATLILALGLVVDMHTVWTNREGIAQLVPSAYGSRVMLRPFLMFAVLAFVWFRYLGPRREGARPIAATAALLLFCAWVVMLVVSDMQELALPAHQVWGYPLCALAYLAYAVFGQEAVEERWGGAGW